LAIDHVKENKPEMLQYFVKANLGWVLLNWWKQFWNVLDLQLESNFVTLCCWSTRSANKWSRYFKTSLIFITLILAQHVLHYCSWRPKFPQSKSHR
jgi:hypothetical protein